MIITNEQGTPQLNTIHNCDALRLLGNMPSQSVNCVVTSPPYFGLRNYQVDGQIGLEETPQAYVAKLVELFREVRRVLRDDGTVWLNLGDSYVGGGGYSPDAPSNQNGGSLSSRRVGEGGGRTTSAIRLVEGLPSKNLLGIPWRVAFGLQDDGWILRSDIIWAKPSCMPESVTDRPTKAHEYIFLFAKSQRYFYDADAIREPLETPMHNPGNKDKRFNKQGTNSWDVDRMDEVWGNPLGRNKRSVWEIATEPNAFAHFATFPTKLIEPMILAGCPDKVCSKCGAAWVREVERETVNIRPGNVSGKDATAPHFIEKGSGGNTNLRYRPETTRQTIGFKPTCTCNADTRPGVVYDPFMGSGTTALVARRHGRNYIGSELNPEYVQIARERLRLPFEDRHVVKPDKPLDKPTVQIGDDVLEQTTLFD